MRMREHVYVHVYVHVHVHVYVHVQDGDRVAAS